MEANNIKKGLNDIENIYKNLTYFDQYGGSVLSLFLITIIVFLLCVYCYAKTNIKPIVDDWPNQRCKPYYIPFAGFITKPANVSATDYTLENFNYCTQNILSSITGYMLEPLTFVTGVLNSVVSQLSGDINSARGMFYKIRTLGQTITQDVMGRLMNIMAPLQQIIISVRDMFGKMQGILTTALFTLLGTYYSLQALMGAIAQFIIQILIGMVALIFLFWLIPFTWGTAISMTAVFVAVSIPLAIMLAFMVQVLHVNPDLSIPTIRVPSLKCFDKDTLILMKDGKNKKIEEISVGDILYYDGMVTAKMKVDTNGSIMYSLHNIIVSDTHLVHFKGEWIRVCEHPESKKIVQYKEPYLYCLNTSSKTIYINNTLFSDWDELVGDDFFNIVRNTESTKMTSSEIHQFLDSGFVGSSLIKLQNNTTKQLQNIEVGDILSHGETVYGIIEIDGKNLKQYEYNLGKDNFIRGVANLHPVNNNLNNKIIKQEQILGKTEDKLYHLVTNTKTFSINEINIYDYNKTIDSLLEQKTKQTKQTKQTK